MHNPSCSLAEAIAVPLDEKTFKAALWTNNGQISPTLGQSFHRATENQKPCFGIKTLRVMARFLLKFMANLSG